MTGVVTREVLAYLQKLKAQREITLIYITRKVSKRSLWDVPHFAKYEKFYPNRILARSCTGTCWGSGLNSLIRVGGCILQASEAVSMFLFKKPRLSSRECLCSVIYVTCFLLLTIRKRGIGGEVKFNIIR